MAHKINIFYQNTRGLRSKTTTLLHNVISTSFDIICLSETWLNSGVLSSELFPEEYEVFRHDRETSGSSKKDGGGVLIAVKSKWNAERCLDLESEAEDIWISLSSFTGNKLYISCVYLPPGDNNAHFSFVNNLYSLQNMLSRKDVCIMGDFNLSNVEWIREDNERFFQATLIDERSAHLIDASSFFNLRQFNNIGNVNNKKLDLVLSNTSFISEVFRSDQCLVVKTLTTHHWNLSSTLSRLDLWIIRPVKFIILIMQIISA
nr:unnamed protein product [Callosobruchus chinensis]